MRKYEIQEVAIEEQEKRHKREMCEIERKFILSKDQLKKDMSSKLLQLSTEFHDATELRIAATTHRVIRENIAVNNELDVLLNNQQRLYGENTNLKTRDGMLRNHNELLLKENKIALAKVRVQIKLIERLTDDHQYMVNQLNKYKFFENEVIASRNKIQELNDKIKHSEFTKRILEQNLHHVRCDRTLIKTEFLYLEQENNRLLELMLEAVSAIKESLTVRTQSEMALKIGKRENLLNYLLLLLNKAKEKKMKVPSLDSVSLFEATYAKGDLGFVPKPVELRSSPPVRRHMDTQTGLSFEEYVATGEIAKEQMLYTEDDESSEYLVSELEGEGELAEEEPRKSLLFFDEQEVVDEESEEGVLVVEEEEELPTKQTKGEFEEGRASETQEGEEVEEEYTEGEESEASP